jgi:hypothetical protein
MPVSQAARSRSTALPGGPAGNTFEFTIAAGTPSPATGLINVFPRQTATISVTGYPLSVGDQLYLTSGANSIQAAVVSTTASTGAATVEFEHAEAIGTGTQQTLHLRLAQHHGETLPPTRLEKLPQISQFDPQHLRIKKDNGV